MNSGKSNKPKFFSASEQLRLNLQKSFTDLQCQCSGLFHHLSRLPLFDPKHYSLKFDLQNNLSKFQNHAKHALDAGISSFYAGPSSSGKDPAWARIESKRSQVAAVRQSGVAMSTEAIEERLAGVPVYALSNGAEEFVLVSGASTGKSLGLFCFKKEDAESLLQQIGSLDPGMRTGSKVVAVALNKVFQLKVNGVAFRLIPEYSQVKNALQEREKAGISDDGFPGVPVFQSRSLILKSENKSYRPLFFRKEDLENSLKRASHKQNQLNQAFRSGDIQVAVLEDVIKGMKESSTSNWEDVVFIPPGFDVSTEPPQQ
ncbi:Protein TIC 22-like, chloroplastic [Quillaja saponaria]|uniref:Protein TIC 22-like, chloroplastic n=1 Tax=Quillaja saponaria TaxID=32244 RepID=A0AAD7QCR2_QUISA|nr:Protein TIC 22-like, chloroplastic [Quillaja saponaria]